MSQSKKKQTKPAAELIVRSSPRPAPAPTVVKKKKRSTGSQWAKTAGKAVEFASSALPMLLPFLMANHAPTRTAATAAGVASAGAPLAVNGTLSSMVGLKDMRVVQRDNKGNVLEVEVTTFDYVTQLNSASFQDGTGLGNVAYGCWISPSDPAFAGTKFAQFGASYERWRLVHGCFIYEPACPATTTGALAMCVFDDPDAALAPDATAQNVRVVSSQTGGETFQVWGAGTSYCPLVNDSKPLYTDPDGSDVRLIVGGKLQIVCATDMSGVGVCGNLYFCAQTRYSIPSLSNEDPAGAGIKAVAATTNNNNTYAPIATATVTNLCSDGATFKVSATYTQSGTSRTGNVFWNLSPGDWLAVGYLTGTAITTTVMGVTDESASYGSVAGTGNTMILAAATSSLMWQPFSIAASGSATIPTVYFNAANTTITAAAWYIFKINDGLFANPSEPMFPGNRFLSARRDFWSRCAGGIAQHTQAEIARQSMLLAQQQKQLDLLKPCEPVYPPVTTPVTPDLLALLRATSTPH